MEPNDTPPEAPPETWSGKVLQSGQEMRTLVIELYEQLLIIENAETPKEMMEAFNTLRRNAAIISWGCAQLESAAALKILERRLFGS